MSKLLEDQIRAVNLLPQSTLRQIVEAQRTLEAAALIPSQRMVALQESLAEAVAPLQRAVAAMETAGQRLALPSLALQEAFAQSDVLFKLRSITLSEPLLRSIRQMDEIGQRLGSMLNPGFSTALEGIDTQLLAERLSGTIAAARAEARPLRFEDVTEVAVDAVETSNPHLRVTPEFMMNLLLALLTLLASLAVPDPAVESLQDEVAELRQVIENHQGHLLRRIEELLGAEAEPSHTTVRDLVLRAGANSKSAVRARVLAGSEVMVLDSSADWYLVAYEAPGSDRLIYGWMYGRYLAPFGASPR